MRANPLLVCFCCLAIVLLAGCGPKYVTNAGVKVKGRIVKGGQPLQVPGRESGTGWVEVNLTPVSVEDLKQYVDTSEQTDADGNFVIEYERGLPPGKYKVAVYQRSTGLESDDLKGAFSKEKTAITVDLDPAKVGGTQDVGTIDLDKPGK